MSNKEACALRTRSKISNVHKRPRISSNNLGNIRPVKVKVKREVDEIFGNLSTGKEELEIEEIPATLNDFIPENTFTTSGQIQQEKNSFLYEEENISESSISEDCPPPLDFELYPSDEIPENGLVVAIPNLIHPEISKEINPPEPGFLEENKHIKKRISRDDLTTKSSIIKKKQPQKNSNRLLIYSLMNAETISSELRDGSPNTE